MVPRAESSGTATEGAGGTAVPDGVPLATEAAGLRGVAETLATESVCAGTTGVGGVCATTGGTVCVESTGFAPLPHAAIPPNIVTDKNLLITISVRTLRRLALAGSVLLSATPALAQRSGQRTWRREDIAARGWHRLGDIVAALPPGTAGSIDGFNWQLGSMSVPMPESRSSGPSAWLFRIDGARIPVDINGLWMFDLAPVAMTQVDSIVVSTMPMIIDGRPVRGGSIDVFTRRPAAPVSVTADYQHGDESGDPGPYRYTPRANPNVEKLGPFTSGAIGVRRSHVAADAGARYTSLNITDQQVLADLGSASPSVQSDVNASGGSGTITTWTDSSEQKTFGGRGRFTGLTLVPSTHQLETARVIGGYGASAGTARIGALKLRYAATRAELDTRPQTSSLPFTIGHTRALTDALIDAPISRFLELGAGVTNWEATASGFASVSRVEGRGWASLNVHDVHGLVAMSVSNNNVLPSAELRASRLLGTTAVGIRAIHLSTRTDSDDGWIGPNGGPIATSKALSTDELRLTLDPANFSWLTGFTRVWRASYPDGIGGDGRWQFGAGLQAGHDIANRVLLHAAAEAVSRRDDESTPGFSASGDASMHAPGNFLLAAAAGISSETTWDIPGSNQSTRGIRRLDLSANKSMWHDRARAQLVLRNLFNTAERYHPLGAQWNLRTHLALTIDLPPYRSTP